MRRVPGVRQEHGDITMRGGRQCSGHRAVAPSIQSGIVAVLLGASCSAYDETLNPV